MKPFNINDMNKETADMFVRLYLMKPKNIEGLYAEMLNHPGGWVLKAIHKYFEANSLDCDERVEIMLLFLSNGVIGYAVKHFADVLKWATQTGCKFVTWDDFAKKVYPDQIPDYSKI